jgi:hypothetical protein
MESPTSKEWCLDSVTTSVPDRGRHRYDVAPAVLLQTGADIGAAVDVVQTPVE